MGRRILIIICFFVCACGNSESDLTPAPAPVAPRNSPTPVPTTAPSATPSPSPTSSPSPVRVGDWGGWGVKLQVTAQGANYELDCAHGVVDQPLQIDEQGHFQGTGTIVIETGGPINEDVPEDRRPAAYTGFVIGDAMTLNISFPPEMNISYSLAYGYQALLFKCQ